MNISEVGRATDLPAKTIRYYEEIGLIQPKRSANGYRSFDAQDVHRLRFLARARALGFSIEDCRSLLALWADRGRASADVRHIAKTHLKEIKDKIAALTAMQATLTELVDACAGNDRPDCPILQGLAD
ncbi:Cu(I)-responsive transcriptional regulator [uncultured Tateyamaria sp.]|uniref:Cu(I)-responsive transcriptional regulator n=1 Tax=uncultured Tateyamaria sp. TaxID=455651 RepID=UPI002607126F|nr:Cu(I)-responsive transcriptional regulator [uncultured Tateyamaria sp.]